MNAIMMHALICTHAMILSISIHATYASALEQASAGFSA